MVALLGGRLRPLALGESWNAPRDGCDFLGLVSEDIILAAEDDLGMCLAFPASPFLVVACATGNCLPGEAALLRAPVEGGTGV